MARLDKAVRREIRRRVERATERVRDDRRDRAARVHEARRDLKKARAALRLLRPRLPSKRFRRENAALRDAGKALSRVRDAQALPAALDALVGRSRRFAAARRTLAAAARSASPDGTLARATRGPLDDAASGLRRLRPDARRWRAVAKGLRRTYAAGRRLMKAARESGRDEDFHEWRKAAKYLRYQLELLFPEDQTISGQATELHRLSDLLGEDHDLGALAARAASDVPAFGGAAAVRRLGVLIERRRAALRREALGLGASLYAPRPKDAGAAWRSARGSARTSS